MNIPAFGYNQYSFQRLYNPKHGMAEALWVPKDKREADGHAGMMRDMAAKVEKDHPETAVEL